MKIFTPNFQIKFLLDEKGDFYYIKSLDNRYPPIKAELPAKLIQRICTFIKTNRYRAGQELEEYILNTFYYS